MPVNALQHRQTTGNYPRAQLNLSRPGARAQPASAVTMPQGIPAVANQLTTAGNVPLVFRRHQTPRGADSLLKKSLLCMLLLSQLRCADGSALSPDNPDAGVALSEGFPLFTPPVVEPDPPEHVFTQAHLPAASTSAAAAPPTVNASGATAVDQRFAVYDKDGIIVDLGTHINDIVDNPEQYSFIQQGQKALNAYLARYHRHYPDLISMASGLLKRKLKQRFALKINPDSTWFMRFSAGASNDKSFTGWEYNLPPDDYGTLTSYLFRNFPASAQENINGVDMLSGIYTVAPNEVRKYDDTNQVPLRPSDFIRLVWDLDFHKYARAKTLRAYRDKDEHIKKAFIDFVTGMAISQLDNESQQDLLNGTGFATARNIEISPLEINGYQAATAFIFYNRQSGNTILYLPESKFKFSAFRSWFDMRVWLVNNCASPVHRAMIAAHFKMQDRQDGIFFAGLDSVLSAINQDPELAERIAASRQRIAGCEFFNALFNNMRDKALSDIRVLIKSDERVRRDIWESYFDAASMIPNPVTLFVSLAFHLEHAFDSDTSIERMEEWHKLAGDAVNLVLMLMLDKVMKFKDNGYDFINRVQQAYPTVAINPESGAGAIRPGTQYLSEALRKIITPDMVAADVSLDELTPPDQQGIRWSADNQAYLQDGNQLLKINQASKVVNHRYKIVAPASGSHYIIFKKGKFYPESLAERLAYIKSAGLSGRGSAATKINLSSRDAVLRDFTVSGGREALLFPEFGLTLEQQPYNLAAYNRFIRALPAEKEWAIQAWIREPDKNNYSENLEINMRIRAGIPLSLRMQDIYDNLKALVYDPVLPRRKGDIIRFEQYFTGEANPWLSQQVNPGDILMTDAWFTFSGEDATIGNIVRQKITYEDRPVACWVFFRVKAAEQGLPLLAGDAEKGFPLQRDRAIDWQLYAPDTPFKVTGYAIAAPKNSGQPYRIAVDLEEVADMPTAASKLKKWHTGEPLFSETKKRPAPEGWSLTISDILSADTPAKRSKKH